MATRQEVTKAKCNKLHSVIYVKFIVISNWMLTLEYINRCLSHLEIRLWNIDYRLNSISDDGNQFLDQLASVLEEANAWRRRMIWYCNEIVKDLESLGIQVEQENFAEKNPGDQDFLSLFRRLRMYKKRADIFFPIATDLLSVANMKISLAESRHISKLTVLSMFFLPLLFTSGLLSMEGRFQPGGLLFWVYFVVAVPILILVILIVWAVGELESLTGKWIIPRKRICEKYGN
jgi:CorA-like Mg2+ transporter protein